MPPNRAATVRKRSYFRSARYCRCRAFAETGTTRGRDTPPGQPRSNPRWRRYAGRFRNDRSARSETVRGLRGMLGRTLREQSGIPDESAIVLAKLADLRKARPEASRRGSKAGRILVENCAERRRKIHVGRRRLTTGAFCTERSPCYEGSRWANRSPSWMNASRRTRRCAGSINGTTSTVRSSAATRGRSIFLDNGQCAAI